MSYFTLLYFTPFKPCHTLLYLTLLYFTPSKSCHHPPYNLISIRTFPIFVSAWKGIPPTQPIKQRYLTTRTNQPEHQIHQSSQSENSIWQGPISLNIKSTNPANQRTVFNNKDQLAWWSNLPIQPIGERYSTARTNQPEHKIHQSSQSENGVWQQGLISLNIKSTYPANRRTVFDNKD